MSRMQEERSMLRAWTVTCRLLMFPFPKVAHNTKRCFKIKP